jgi:hypothetical protein
MSSKKTVEKKITKKQAREIVYNKLTSALSDYKNASKPKKFEAKLKKVSKVLAPQVIKASKTLVEKVKYSSKKTAKKKPFKTDTGAQLA